MARRAAAISVRMAASARLSVRKSSSGGEIYSSIRCDMVSTMPFTIWFFRQAVCERRVKNGKARELTLTVIGVFLAGGEICDNGGLVQLAARGRNGENDAERDTGFGALPVYIKLFPEVALRRCSHGDGLGAVDRAAAADGKNEVDLMLPAKLDALVHLFSVRGFVMMPESS